MRNLSEVTKYQLSNHIKNDLKILPEFFEDVYQEKKCFELRLNDRNYQVGDVFILREYIPGQGYTGKQYINIIEYILKDCPEYGLQEGYCIFGW